MLYGQVFLLGKSLVPFSQRERRDKEKGRSKRKVAVAVAIKKIEGQRVRKTRELKRGRKTKGREIER